LKIALVTTTFSKKADDLRAKLALRTVYAANQCGYQIHIVDGSPDPEVANRLCAAGAFVEAQKVKGMGASRRQCFEAGLNSGADVIVWLEPEKYPFVCQIKPCAEMIETGHYDIVFPGRKTLVGYPQYQELSELRAMRRIGFLTGQPYIDWMFGPRVLSRKGAELLKSYDGKLGDEWQILIVPVLQQLWIDEKKVGAKMVDYIHPPEQTAAEEGDATMDAKRDHQRKVLEEVVEEEVRRLNEELRSKGSLDYAAAMKYFTERRIITAL